jgi:hypothetical protein
MNLILPLCSSVSRSAHYYIARAGQQNIQALHSRRFDEANYETSRP